MKKKVVSKGYTVRITSYEGDCDRTITNFIVTEHKEYAESIYKICTELFKSINRSENPGIGNACGGDDMDNIINKWINNNFHHIQNIDTHFNNTFDLIDNNVSSDTIFEILLYFAANLIDSSDRYYFRVCSECTVTYLPEDVFAEEIEFG